MNPPPLPDLTQLSREQLIDCCHRLNTSLMQIATLVRALEQNVELLTSRVRQLESSHLARTEGDGG